MLVFCEVQEYKFNDFCSILEKNGFLSPRRYYFCIIIQIIMPDVLSPAQRHRNMAAIRSASTKPELRLRKALWRQGYRYRINDKSLPGSPDIVLPKYRTAIFVHGCFWHGHKGCKNYTVPKTNTDFWKKKITRNQQRDQEVWRQLEAKGWHVIIVWECQLKKAAFDNTLSLICEEIIANGEAWCNELAERKASREAYRCERKAQKAREAAFKSQLRRQ